MPLVWWIRRQPCFGLFSPSAIRRVEAHSDDHSVKIPGDIQEVLHRCSVLKRDMCVHRCSEVRIINNRVLVEVEGGDHVVGVEGEVGALRARVHIVL